MSYYIYNLWGDICDNDIEKDKLFEYIYNNLEYSYNKYINDNIFELSLYCRENFNKINNNIFELSLYCTEDFNKINN